MALYKDVRLATFGPLDLADPAPASESVADAERAVLEELDKGPSVEEIAAEARAQGFAQGCHDGLQQMQEMHLRSARRLVHMITRVLVDADRLAQSVEHEVVELSLAVAEKVIEREIQMDPTIVLGIVRAALKEMHRAPIADVRVHPDDYALLAAHWEDVAPKSLGERVQLLADEDVEVGGCLIETRHGQADAQPSSKLAHIAEAFEALREGDSA